MSQEQQPVSEPQKRMNPEVKEHWTSAMLSGRFPQTEGFLHRLKDKSREAQSKPPIPAGYCCLGVLCELAIEQNVMPRFVPDKMEAESDLGAETYGVNREDFSQYYLPDVVVKWAGLKHFANGDGDIKLRLDGGETSLGTLNDAGKTFQEIAAIIEENL